MTVGRQWTCEQLAQISRAVRRNVHLKVSECCAKGGMEGGWFVSVVTLRGGVALARAAISVVEHWFHRHGLSPFGSLLVCFAFECGGNMQCMVVSLHTVGLHGGAGLRVK